MLVMLDGDDGACATAEETRIATESSHGGATPNLMGLATLGLLGLWPGLATGKAKQ